MGRRNHFSFQHWCVKNKIHPSLRKNIIDAWEAFPGKAPSRHPSKNFVRSYIHANNQRIAKLRSLGINNEEDLQRYREEHPELLKDTTQDITQDVK